MKKNKDKKKSSFGFKQTSKKALAERIANVGKSDYPSYLSNKVKKYVIRDGDNFIRIVPPRSDDETMKSFVKDIVTHFVPKSGSFLCTEKMYNTPCPICKRWKKAKAQGRDDKIVKDIAPKTRGLMQILDIHDKPQDDGVLVFDAPGGLIDDIMRASIKRKSGEVVVLDDPSEGREIAFTKVVKKGQSYPEYKHVEIGAVYEIDADEIVPQLKLFDDILMQPDIDKLKSACEFIDMAMKKDEDEEEDEEETNSRRRSKRYEEDEEEEDEEEEDDDDDDEDDGDDDEDGEEDEEDEEEEEKKLKKKKTKKKR